MSLTGAGSADSHVISYRPDIDGLRAIAVLSVIAYHMRRGALPGGYLGVDIFFVLSGFLITSIIWGEIRAGSFSLARFYDRRVRRIMPALLLLLLVGTPVAAALLLPSDLVGYGRSLLATLGFAANVYFWRDTNYFARAAGDKPLLHLWSLGVEEQFYILFPLILALLWRRWPRHARAVIGALTLLSLASNAAALYLGADSTAFFLLPARAWELGLGALLVLIPPPAFAGSWRNEAIAGVGLSLVVLGLAAATQFVAIMPTALPAALGVSMIIWASRGGGRPPAISRVLQLPPLRFTGLVSYSLYLWHWPILVFAQYYLVRDLRPGEMGAAFIAMLACAVASWFFIERPFRRSTLPIRRVRWTAAAGAAALCIAAAFFVGTGGLPERLSPAAAAVDRAVGTNYRCPISQFILLGASRACLMNLPSRNAADAEVILLGNSHAQMYAPLFAELLAERRETGLLIPANGCLPTIEVNITRGCIETARANLTEVEKLSNARLVILGLDWAHGPAGLVDAQGRTVDNGGDAALVAALDALVGELKRADKEVVLIGPIAEPGWDVASIISRQMAFGRPIDRPLDLPEAEFLRRYGPAIRHFEGRGDVRLARPDRVQCAAGRCAYLIDGRPLFADNGHIAQAELERFRGIFEAVLPPPAQRPAPVQRPAAGQAPTAGQAERVSAPRDGRKTP
jgi:peptidoglycan/LPS O-acetylase OafA/YrhL